MKLVITDLGDGIGILLRDAEIKRFCNQFVR
jgi:hypothetical protein